MDDTKSYDMMARGDTGGVFTFETQGYRSALQQMRPDRFEDLIAIQALNRPGPMANIPDYCARKHGASWTAPDPAIHDILAETYGVIVYQEQVMQIAQIMAGYSLASADLLRRAMGKKIRAEMDKQREIFVEGATAKGHSIAKANEIFDLMAKFADYGFNKSHAAAYALVSYQTAYLRANHPVEFLAACMSLSITNTDKLATLRADAIRMGLPVFPPDINHSDADFKPEMFEGKHGIRYALGAIKRIGVAAMEDLVNSRGTKAFADISEFAARIDTKNISRGQIEILAKTGAFDTLDTNRARVFTAAEAIVRTAQAQAEEKLSGQIGLFGNAAEPEKIRLPQLPDWSESDRLAFEAEAIGFHISAHPLDMYATALKRLSVIPSTEIERRAQAGASRVKLAGTVSAKKERITKNGSRMVWVTLSDTQGSFEVTLFSEVLGRVREYLTDGTALLVTADIKMEAESLRITATDVTLLDDAAAKAGASLRIWLDRTEALPHIRALLDREGRGRGRVTLVPKTGLDRDLDIILPGQFNVTAKLAQAMKLVPGVELVEDI